MHQLFSAWYTTHRVARAGEDAWLDQGEVAGDTKAVSLMTSYWGLCV